MIYDKNFHEGIWYFDFCSVCVNDTDSDVKRKKKANIFTPFHGSLEMTVNIYVKIHNYFLKKKTKTPLVLSVYFTQPISESLEVAVAPLGLRFGTS